MTIFHTFLQKLSLKKPASADVESLKASLDLHRQYANLWRLQNTRQLLEITLPGHKNSYQSMIIALDISRGLLWLDELFPNQPQLALGDEITLRHHRNGEILTFSTPVIAMGSNFGASGIAVLLPEEAKYQPRRAHPRCNLNNRAPISAKIRLLGQDACFGTIKDISCEGLSLLVPGNLIGQIHQGTILPLCEVHLNNELHIHCRAQVRSFQLCRQPYRATRISLEFIDLQPKRRLQLQEFVHRLTLSEAMTTQAA